MELFRHYDADRSGAIDFDEFCTLMETVMPVKQAYREAMKNGDVSIDMMAESLGGLAMLNQSTEDLIQAEACAVSPLGATLQPVTMAMLHRTPYHYSPAGFVCAKCNISCDNLADKTGWYAAGEQYMICGMCAQLETRAQIVEMRELLTIEKKKSVVKPFLPHYLKHALSPCPSPKSRTAKQNVEKQAPLGPKSRVTQAFAATLLEEE
eukprot:g10675.t1